MFEEPLLKLSQSIQERAELRSQDEIGKCVKISRQVSMCGKASLK